ncbi:MAG: Na/Pi cotransporter family protein [Treponema sp.]|nr:Na/Pi cotransporter family protein [Candidatus Treponema caballi]
MTVIVFLLKFVGSLGFLMYGMKLMSDGVQKSAGERLQRTLSALTGNRLMGLFTGLLITMIIQSSGATTVMVVTFVNAGLMTLRQSAGVIFGANIGTTITAWIVSLFGFNFNISDFAMPVFGIGFFLTLLKKNGYRNWGEALMGFGLLFIGLSNLSDALSVEPERLGWLLPVQNYGFISILTGFFIGIVITALLHSSSAFSAIVITMAYNGLLSWEFSAALTLGSNIGSTIDAVLAAVGTSADAKRSALIHVLFNVVGTALALVFFRPFLALVDFVTPASANIAIRISMLHTVFKTLSTILFLPFANQLASFTERIIPEKKDESGVFVLEFPENADKVKENATAFIIRAEKAVADMADNVVLLYGTVIQGFDGEQQKFMERNVPAAEQMEAYIDQMHEEITHYLVKCETLPVTQKQMTHISHLIQTVDEYESLADNCFSVAKLIERRITKGMVFDSDDVERFEPYVELASQFVDFIHLNTNKAFDNEMFGMANSYEEQIDAMKKNLKKVGRKRIEKGGDVKTELLYIDLVRQIEKIGDNCFAIAESAHN